MSENRQFFLIGIIGTLFIVLALASEEPSGQTSLSWQWQAALMCTLFAMGKMVVNIIRKAFEERRTLRTS